MKPVTFLRLAFLLLVPAAAAAQTTPPDRSGTEEVVNPDKGSVDDALERAATRPLRDLNIMKPKVAPELAAMMSDPYDIKALRTCRQLNGEVHRITRLIGPDVDDPTLTDRKGRRPVEMLVDSAEGITGSLIPGQGLIRQLTGANNAAREALAARLAGLLRRAHVKGVLKARRCRIIPPPADTAAKPD
jgi:hypothetical protein